MTNTMMRNYIYILFFMIGAVYASAQNPPKITTTQIQNLIVDSTRINATGDTAYYYQNGVLIGTGPIAGGGGGGYWTQTGSDIYYNTGNVGIGTSSPSGKLQVNDSLMVVDDTYNVVGINHVPVDGNNTLVIKSSPTNVSGDVVLKLFTPNTGLNNEDGFNFGIQNSTQDVYINQRENANVFFYVNGGAAMTIDSSRNVGIGTTSPSAMLTVYGEETFFVKDIAIGNNQKNGFGSLGNNFVFYVNDTASLVLTHQSGTPSYRDFRVPLDYKYGWSGNVINNGSMTANLSLYDDGNTNTVQVSDGSDPNDDGKFRASAFDVSSDRRLKEDIADINYGIKDIMLLQPKTYYKNNDFTKRRIGFIAQDVENYIPEVVNTPIREDLYYSIEYDAFIPILTKAIQEQQAIIESQSTEIEQLKTLITELSNRLTILENN